MSAVDLEGERGGAEVFGDGLDPGVVPVKQAIQDSGRLGGLQALRNMLREGDSAVGDSDHEEIGRILIGLLQAVYQLVEGGLGTFWLGFHALSLHHWRNLRLPASSFDLAGIVPGVFI